MCATTRALLVHLLCGYNFKLNYLAQERNFPMAINGIRPAKRAARTQGGLSLEMHGAVGWSLHAMRNTLVMSSVFMGNTYSKHAMWRLERPFRDLDRLRCRLDSCVFQEYPALLHAARVYYPVDESVVPALPMTSLEGVCEYLAASAVAVRHIADLPCALPRDLGGSGMRHRRYHGVSGEKPAVRCCPPKWRPDVARERT